MIESTINNSFPRFSESALPVLDKLFQNIKNLFNGNEEINTDPILNNPCDFITKPRYKLSLFPNPAPTHLQIEESLEGIESGQFDEPVEKIKKESNLIKEFLAQEGIPLYISKIRKEIEQKTEKLLMFSITKNGFLICFGETTDGYIVMAANLSKVSGDGNITDDSSIQTKVPSYCIKNFNDGTMLFPIDRIINDPSPTTEFLELIKLYKMIGGKIKYTSPVLKKNIGMWDTAGRIRAYPVKMFLD